MQALGCFIILLRPPTMTQTEGGIQLPQTGPQKYYYGMVKSVGQGAREHAEIAIGDVIAFDPQGEIDLVLNTLEGTDEQITIIRYEGVGYAKFSDEDIEAMGMYDFKDERKALKKSGRKALHTADA